MKKIVGVRFKPVGKIYYFDPVGFDIKAGDAVIVETARGVEFAEVVLVKEIEEKSFDKPLKTVIRIATPEDRAKSENNRKREKEAFSICEEKIKNHGLDMNLVDAEYTFDGNKLLFYFTADGRIDFRELVKDLATVFRTRIELRQIGVRDEAKMLGSVGVCGRSICCSQFLGEFMPVSIKMAKEQGLSLNPAKISGSCGRLMCCLKYEQEGYEELLKNMPKPGAIVKTPSGKGKVENINVLKQKVYVRLENAEDQAHHEFSASEIKTLKNAHVDDEIEKLDEEILKTLEE
ncbi:MAG: stage 0 sporulation family protein [Clostridia bacterium]|nr:stage 0 sporulation family protein [Clostridia bacterium]